MDAQQQNLIATEKSRRLMASGRPMVFGPEQSASSIFHGGRL
jgi:hypothetical protein